MAAVLEVRALSKVYRAGLGRRTLTALDGIDLSVRPGEVFGLLGPNGAGKTTAVKILLGLTRPTSGTAHLHGLPSSDPASRRRVGYLPEGHRFPGYLSAQQTLSIFGRMSGVSPRELASRIPLLLARVRLSDWADVKVKRFSKGMTQRLGLAAALVHEPDVLLLDEPTDGVDPVGRIEIRDLLREEAARGCAVLVNSHLLSEIEKTCDRVAILRRGRVVTEGRLSELSAAPALRWKVVADGVDEALLEDLRRCGGDVVRQNGHLEVSARDAAHLNSLVDAMRARGALLRELTPLRESLEDLFVGLVRAGEAADEADEADEAGKADGARRDGP